VHRTRSWHLNRPEVDRLAHLSSSLLQFGRPGAAHRTPTDVVRLVDEAVAALGLLPEAEKITIN
jgi:signal transduction histidine kinase